MSDHDPNPAGSEPDRSSDRAWFGRRKRIVSREVSSAVGEARAEVRAEMYAAAGGSLQPADVIDIPSLPAGPPPEMILDPTLFNERQRRSGQNVAYRFTQLITFLAPMAASGAIAFSFFGHRLRAMVLAGAACLLSAIAIPLVRRSRLARRLRGYAAAACILALIALFFSLMPSFIRDEGKPAPPEKKAAPLDHAE